MRSWVNNLFACVIALSGSTAIAAPNHTVWVEDQLFAQTNDTLMILRTIHDNGASYYTLHLDTFLVTLSRTDGNVLNIAPVERSTTHSVGEPDIDGTTYVPIENAIDPYTQRAAVAASPLSDPEGPGWRTTQIGNGTITLFLEDEATHSAPLAPLMDQLIASIVQTRAILPLIPDQMGQDPLDPTRQFLASNCEADRVITQWSPDNSLSAYVRLSCLDWGDEATHVFWAVVPPVSQ